jgi:hypothetical protein
MKTYTLFLSNGDKEIVKGDSIADAINKSYGDKTFNLDFWSEGDYRGSDKFIFNEEKCTWVSNLFFS